MNSVMQPMHVIAEAPIALPSPISKPISRQQLVVARGFPSESHIYPKSGQDFFDYNLDLIRIYRRLE